jgi:hypothetical protein
MKPATRAERDHFSLFVPGTPASLHAWQSALAAHGLLLEAGDPARLHGPELPFEVRAEWIDNPRDGGFGKAFSFGTATKEEQQRIEAAGGALLLWLPVDLHTGRKAIATLLRKLESCGGLAVRIEESKAGYPIGKWLALVEGEDPWALFRAAVVTLGEPGLLATCGMQVFSLPDAALPLEATADRRAATALLHVLCVYQLAEDPLLLSGNTFAPDAQTPRRVLHHWPDTSYPRGHRCHNPFGAWRLGPEGEQAQPAPKLAPTFLPALVVLLAALEQKEARPLTQDEVLKVRDEAACMAMDHADVRQLVRSRGYADIDPELAWEQWQVLRRTE